MPNHNSRSCPEPDGREVVDGADTAHDVMLAATGQCPWCGAEEG